jgi:hypothetical protein
MKEEIWVYFRILFRDGRCGQEQAPLRFSLACLDFSFLFRGVQRGYFSFEENGQQHHEREATVSVEAPQ